MFETLAQAQQRADDYYVLYLVWLSFAILSGTFVVIAVANKLRDLKFRYWITRTPYIITLLRTKTGSIVPYLHKEDDIFSDGEVRMSGGSYTIIDEDESGRPLRYNWEGHSCYVFSHDKRFPEAFVPGNSLDSYFTPQFMGEIADGLIAKRWREAQDTPSTLLNTQTFLLIVAILAIGTVGYLVYQQTITLDGIKNAIHSIGSITPPIGGVTK